MKFRRKKKESHPKYNPRPKREPLPTECLASSVFLAYGIVLLNVLLIAAIGLLVLFFRGIVHYMTWIFVAGLIAIFVTGYYFLRRMRHEQRRLKEILSLPEFSGRNVEISLLGGFAALRMGAKKIGPAPPSFDAHAVLQLEAPENLRVRDLTELGRMLEKGLITREEYELAKQEIFRHAQPSALPEVGCGKTPLVDITPHIPENERKARSL